MSATQQSTQRQYRQPSDDTDEVKSIGSSLAQHAEKRLVSLGLQSHQQKAP
jgi:hypothetical protein